MRKQKDLSREASTSTWGDTAGSAPCPEKEKQNFDILRVWTFCYHFPLALCYNTPPPVNLFFFNAHLLFTLHIYIVWRCWRNRQENSTTTKSWWWGSGQDAKRQAHVQNDKASLGLGPPSCLLSVLPTATFLQVTLIFSCHVTTKRLELPNNGEILFRYATRCGPSSITQDCCRKFNFLLHRGSVHFLWRLD